MDMDGWWIMGRGVTLDSSIHVTYQSLPRIQNFVNNAIFLPLLDI